MDELITTAEAARRLGVSPRWVARLCADGRIEGAKKLGKTWLLLAGAKIAPAPAQPGRPLRTEIPVYKHYGAGPGSKHAGAGPRAGKKKGK